MNKKILLTITALFITQVGFAQIELDDYVNNVSEAFEGTTVATFKYTAVEGTPFLFENFVKGVLISGKSQTVPVNLNFDLANNQIIVSQDRKLIGIDNAAVTSIKIESPNITFKNRFNTNGKDDLNKNSLFEVVFEGESFSLLKHTGVTLQKDVSSYGTAVQTDVYIKYTSYYIIKNGEFDRLKMNKRNILRAFGDKRKTVDSYAKDNRIDFKNDADLAKLFSYANSL